MKLFLIGLPGSGKTTIGAALANRLSMEFVDLDKEIETREGNSVPEIFAAHGEAHFRQVESTLLLEWATAPRSFVMATGGGTPCFFDGIKVINEHGFSVFLDEQIDVIVARLEHNEHRPLLKSANVVDMRTKLERLREARLSVYQKASITVSSPTVNKVLSSLPGM